MMLQAGSGLLDKPNRVNRIIVQMNRALPSTTLAHLLESRFSYKNPCRGSKPLKTS